MVRVVGSQTLENCLDLSVVREIQVSEPIGEEIMHRLARHGKLQFFPEFPRPYFRIDRSRMYVIQGVFGNKWLRVTFSPLADADAEDQLRTLIETPMPGPAHPEGSEFQD